MSLSLTAKDIKKNLNEAFNEGKLGGAAPLGAKPRPMGAPVKAPQASVLGGTMFHPTCREAFYQIDQTTKTEYLTCVYDWIPKQYQARIVALLNQAFPQICSATSDNADTKMTAYNQGKNPSDRLMPPPIVFKLTEDKEHEFINAVVPGFVRVLERISGTANNNMGVGKADMDTAALQNLVSVTKGRIDSAVNAGDQEAADKRMLQSWNQMFDKLTDPSVYAKFQQITGVFVAPAATTDADDDNHDIDAGYKLSAFNKMQVMLQLPNATFVTQKWVWESKWHRSIIDESQYAIIRKPRNNFKSKRLDKAIWDKATQQVTKGRYSNWHEFCIDVKPDKPQYFAVMFAANKMAPQNEWVSVKVYDVANTQKMTGFENDTTWEDTSNYIDNLQGIPNPAYHNKYDPINGRSIPVPPPTLHNYDDEDYYLIDKFMKEKVLKAQQQNNLNLGGVNSVGSVYDDIIHKAYTYGLANSQAANRFSQGRKEAYGKAVAVQLGASFGLLGKSKLLKRYYDELKNGDDNKETSLKSTINLSFPLVSPLIAQLNNFLLNDHRKKHSDRRQLLAPQASTPTPQIDLDTASLDDNDATSTPAPQAAPAPAAQAPAPQVTPAPAAASSNDDKQKDVMEESMGSEWTLEDAYRLFGIDGDAEDGVESVEMDEDAAPESLMESFFKFYDKLERL